MTADNCSARSRKRVLSIEKSLVAIASQEIDFQGILMNRSIRYSSQM